MDIYLPTIRDLCALVLRAADGEMPDDPNEYSAVILTSRLPTRPPTAQNDPDARRSSAGARRRL